jgi:hypothetical protein
MWLLPLALPFGVLVGCLAGGDWHRIARYRLHWWGLLAVALVIGLIVGLNPDAFAGGLLLLISLVAYLAVALRNLHIVGMGVVAVGIMANMIPVLVNGHMPVRPEALVQAELADAGNYDQVQLGTGRELAEENDHLTWLGPVVPVSLVSEVLSWGDLIVMAGLLDIGFRAVKPHSARPVRKVPKHAANRRPRLLHRLAPVEPLVVVQSG